jgi:site-specific DNA-methyltransferase (adenine-specific)
MITLLNGDCLDISHEIPDETVDLILTDPPYNISERGAKPEWIDPTTGENKNTVHSQKFDESFEHNWDSVSHEDFVKLLSQWSNLWYSKLRPGGSFAIFISDVYISYLWSAAESVGLEPKRIFTWKKPAAVPFNRRVNPVSGCEYILWGIKPIKGNYRRTFNADASVGTIVERYSAADKVSSIVYKYIAQGLDLKSAFDMAEAESLEVLSSRKVNVLGQVECVIPNTIVYSGGSTRDRIHPTQKPQEILEYFIALLTNEGDLVLDTFAGSGSTGRASLDRSRRAILVERDPVMFSKMSEKFKFE